MSFWKDKGGAIWVDNYTGRTMYCLWDPELPDDDYEIGLPMETKEVIQDFGPLHWISPALWDERMHQIKEFIDD